MEQLKKCPFCGGEADFIKDTRTIKCKCCGGAFICTNPLISTLEVAEAWNTRKSTERIVERLEAEYLNSVCKNVESCDYPENTRCCYDRAIEKAIEIVKEEMSKI